MDFVITWVNGNDQEWINEKKKYKPFDTPNEEERFRDYEILNYWFRAVEKYAPWVNKIFFVTCGHIPEWLNINNSKLKIIKHRDFIPEEYLPTFNSHTIEWNLHRIPGLSECFVYFNDDMFINQAVQPTDFFVNELPKATCLFNPISPILNDVANIKLNDMIIVNKYYDKNKMVKQNWKKYFYLKNGIQNFRGACTLPWKNFLGFWESHDALCLRKKDFKILWDLEHNFLNEICMDKFRNDSHINLWTLKYLNFARGQFYPQKYKFSKMIGTCDGKFQSLLSSNYKLICINDSTISDFEKTKQELIEAFESSLPQKSTFEK